jgi:hypothetical protein
VTDYLLLYRGGRMPETDAERDQVMKAWDEWFHALGGSLKDGGNPFTPNVKTIAADGAVSDGSGGPAPSGYSVITADSLDEAVTKAKGCPVTLGGASIMVFETFEVM